MKKEKHSKFPPLPFELNQVRKLSNSQIKQVKKLKERGWSLKRIALKYKVSTKTILYWTNEEFRQAHIKDSARRSKLLDKETKRKYVDSYRLNARNFPKRRTWEKEYYKSYYLKNIEKKMLQDLFRYYRDKMRFYQKLLQNE